MSGISRSLCLLSRLLRCRVWNSLAILLSLLCHGVSKLVLYLLRQRNGDHVCLGSREMVLVGLR